MPFEIFYFDSGSRAKRKHVLSRERLTAAIREIMRVRWTESFSVAETEASGDVMPKVFLARRDPDTDRFVCFEDERVFMGLRRDEIDTVPTPRVDLPEGFE